MRKIRLASMFAGIALVAACGNNNEDLTALDRAPIEEPNIIDPPRIDLNYVSGDARCFFALDAERKIGRANDVNTAMADNALRFYKDSVTKRFGEHNITQLMEVEAQRVFNAVPDSDYNPNIFKDTIAQRAKECRALLGISPNMMPKM